MSEDTVHRHVENLPLGWKPDAARLESEVQEFRQRSERAKKEREAVPASTVETIDEDRTCGTCGKAFRAKALVMNGRPILAAAHCEACVEDRLRADGFEAHDDQQARLHDLWEDICPPDYRDTDLVRLMKGREEIMSRILETPADRGLILVGPTDRGKTRILFELLRRHHFAGIEVAYVNGATFADKLAAQYGDGAHAAERFMMRHIKVPVLFYDDLGKEATSGPNRKMSERAEEALYRLVEERKAHRRPLLITSNKTSKELLERLSLDRGEPILRRLKQMCASITL